jgi:uncharacterized membrane protein
MPIVALTSLPNLHPAVVHFPIALLLAALAVDLLAVSLPRRAWMGNAAALLWVLGAAGAGAAFLTGRQAGDSLGVTSPAVEAALARHADVAQWTLVAAAATAILRLALAWAARAGSGLGLRAGRAGALGLGFGVAVLVSLTADRGGTLVYRHGVAVAAAGERSPAPAGVTTAPVQQREPLTRLAGGGLLWSPASGDVLTSDGAVTVIAAAGVLTPEPASADAGAGLTLRVDGRAFMLLPGEFADVQVKAVLDLAGFQGTAGLVHHYRDERSYGAFEIKGAASQLVDRRGEASKVLGEGRAAAGQMPATLVVSGVGSHFKGFSGSEAVVHGHTAAPPAGRTGLLLDGRGVLRLLELRVEPASGH